MRLLAFILVLLAAQDDPVTFRGTLRVNPKLEGGVRTLTVNSTTYDLHGMPDVLVDGDVVEVRGTPEPDRVCIHMAGVVFRVASARKIAGP